MNEPDRTGAGEEIGADAAALVAQLWPCGDCPEGLQVYAIVDAARDPCIYPLVQATGLEHCCLFAGPLSPALQRAAPYLVHLSPTAVFTQEFFRLGWGRSWGILAVARPDVTLPVLRRHFRSLLRVGSEGGRHMLFRFYDPRVLRLHMDICDAADAAKMVGPASYLACESDGEGLTRRYEPPRMGCASGRNAAQPLMATHAHLLRLKREKVVHAAVAHLSRHWPLLGEPPAAAWVARAVDDASLLMITDIVATLRYVAIAALYRANGMTWPDACALKVILATDGSPERRVNAAARHDEIAALIAMKPISELSMVNGVLP